MEWNSIVFPLSCYLPFLLSDCMSLNGSLSFNALFSLFSFWSTECEHFEFFLFSVSWNQKRRHFPFFFRFMCFCHIAFVLQWTGFLFKHGNSPVVLKCSCTSPVTLDVIFVFVNSRMVKKLYASCSTLVNVRLLLLLLLLCFCPSFSTICFLVEGMNLFFYFLLFGTMSFFSLQKLWTTKFIKASVT